MYFNTPWINTVASIYARMVFLFGNFQGLLIFFMRLAWGHQFFLSGLNRFAHIDSVIESFKETHFPLPFLSSYGSAIVEIAGGLALIFGFASHLFAFLLTIGMFIAYVSNYPGVFSYFRFLKDPSLLVMQPPFPFFITSLIVTIFGPGKLSLDAWIKHLLQKNNKLD